MKRLFVSMLLVCSLLCTSQISHAQSSADLNVGSKSVRINSTINQGSGNGYTGSDGTVYAKVSVVYTYTNSSGKRCTKTDTDGYVYRVANAFGSASAGGHSVKIESSHEAIYLGVYNSGKTSVSY